MISKPPLPVSIDYGHPLAQGLLCCLLANELGGPMVDLVTGNAVALGSATWGVFSFGPGVQTASFAVTAWSRLKAVTQECSILFRGHVVSGAGGFSPLFGLSYATPSASPFYVYYLDRGSTGGTVRINWNAAGTQKNLAGTPTAYDGTLRQYVGVIRGSSGLCELYETTASGITSRLNSVTESFNPNSTATSKLEGIATTDRFQHGYIWNRALTVSEIQWLFVEPYAFVKATPRARRFGLSIAPTLSIAAVQASYRRRRA